MGSKSKRKFKRQNESLTIKQQEDLMQDVTDLIVLVLAHREYVKSIGKEEEAKDFVTKFVADARDKALSEIEKKVS